MPARTNPFQQVIAAIHRQFEGKDCTVTESAMKQIKGQPTEIDVHIESKLGGHTVQVAIECRCHKRRGDAAWIREMRGKYIDSGMKAVAVHCLGFTRGALHLAREFSIECISTTEAANKDWYKELQRGHFIVVGLGGLFETRSPPRFYDLNGVLIPSDLSACGFTMESGLIVGWGAFVDGLVESSVAAHVDAALASPDGLEIQKLAIGGQHLVDIPHPLSVPISPRVLVNLPTPPWALRLSRMEINIAASLLVERPQHAHYAFREDMYAAVQTKRADGSATTLVVKLHSAGSAKIIAQINPPASKHKP